MSNDFETDELKTKPDAAPLALRVGYDSQTPIEVTPVVQMPISAVLPPPRLPPTPPQIGEIRQVKTAPQLPARTRPMLPPPAAPAVPVATQVLLPPVERSEFDDAVRDHLPTVKIRNRRAIQLWYRGPRMPIGLAFACLCIAIVCGGLLGAILRVSTYVALEERARAAGPLQSSANRIH